jgi:3-phosphoshikimate 1-carboxyvinyltransferase
VGINETRDGIIRVIRAMGGDISVSNIHIEGREPVADLTVKSSSLRGTEISGSVIPTLIDEIPVIAVMAACTEGQTVIRDAGELKVKETNRLRAITVNLRKMGIRVTETDDGMIIEGGKLKGCEIDPDGDHRMAMAFSVAGLVSKGETTITDEGCVDVSYPDFYEDLESLF